MNEFINNYCTVVRGFIDSTTIQTVARYVDLKVKHKQFEERPEVFNFQLEPSKYSEYADPLIELILENSVPDIEEITGLKVFPTYSFSRVYMRGDKLTPHVDRPSCEISATVNVLTNGENLWPIWMKAPNMEPIKIELNPGDMVVYKGCEVTHWRNTMVECDSNTQFMLHYVDQNGPYADFKWDKRPGLGYNFDKRSM